MNAIQKLQKKAQTEELTDLGMAILFYERSHPNLAEYAAKQLAEKEEELAGLRTQLEEAQRVIVPFAKAWKNGGSKESDMGAAFGECVDRVDFEDFMFADEWMNRYAIPFTDSSQSASAPLTDAEKEFKL